jgi:peroxiredoxin Q/BCP
MKICFSVVLIVVFFLGGCMVKAQDLKIGDKAPDFSMAGSDGKVHKLSEYLGKKPIVLAWFPKAFTGG